MYFDSKLKMIAVGLHNGDIQIYTVEVENNFHNYAEVKINLFS